MNQKTTFLFRRLYLTIILTISCFLSSLTSFSQQWDIMGNEAQIASAATTGTSIVVLNESGNEIPYVAFLENNIPRVKKRGTNGIWTQVGGDIDIALSSSYPYLNIFADANGKLFVSYILGDKKVYVKTYNTATTSWEPLNNDNNNKMVSSANGVFVTSTNFKSPRSYMAFDSSNNIYIAYTADGICNIKKYNNTSNVWESYGNTIGSTFVVASQKIIFDEAGTLWVGVVTATAWNSTVGNIKLFKYNAGTSTFDDTASTTNPTNSVRELDMAVVKGTGTTSGRIAVAVNNTTDGTRGVVSLYDKVANSWTSTNVGYSNKAATYIHIISDDFGNLYCNWVDQTATSTSTCAVKKLNAGTTTPWYEIKNPATVRGVDEPTSNTNLGIASGSTLPHIIYTKANSAATSTPIVRKYNTPTGTAPVITSFSPAFTATTPAPSVAFTISGTNFTGATAVTFGGNPVTSFVVGNDSSITGTTSATAVANLTISVTTPNGTATVTGTAPSALSYPSAVSTYNGGPWTPTVTAPSTLVYSISPALPAGLSFNLGTGVISGQSTTAVASAPYTITATNNFGSATATINFATGVAPTSLSYGTVPSSYGTGTAITPLVATITTGTGTPVYTVSPSLPTGLVLDPNTGGISGTPTAITASTAYTVTATTIYGFTTKVITFSTITPPTWNGTAWSNTTGPTASLEAIIDGTYSTTTNGAFTALKLTVNAGKSLTINTGTKVTVQNEVINNGTLVVENNANLIQVNNTTNTGAITVQRNSNALSRLDYTLWSSPVTGQNLVAFSPLTSQSPSRFYTYDAVNNVYAAVATPASTNFSAGTGYLIRMPNTAAVAPATETFAGVFTGVPNNGTVSLTGLIAGKFYAVGNPYPSTLSAASFLSGNATAGTTLYLWRKTNGVANSGSSYATWTTLGGTAAGNVAPNDIAPNGTIQVGQGFIVNSGTATTLTFTNAMREAAPTSTQFLKIAKTDETSRIWLNLTSTGLFSQTLIGYLDGATEGVDNGIDGKYINDSKIALTSDINGEEYTIQGRPAFDAADIVPLNFKTDKAGEYKIAIDHTDGLFAKGQNVYLVDSVTGTETNLTKEAYTFTAESGATNSRFSLKYESTSKVGSPVFNENTVTVYKNNGTLYVNSAASAIVNIKVFNIQGRLIAELKGVNATTAAIKNLKATQQVLLIQVTSEDKKVVTKKVVN